MVIIKGGQFFFNFFLLFSFCFAVAIFDMSMMWRL